MRIEQAARFDSEPREAARGVSRSSGSSVSLVPVLVVEGRGAGRKAKRPVGSGESDEYCPPRKRRCVKHQGASGAVSGPAEAAPVSPSDDQTEGENLMSSGRAGAMIDQEPAVMPGADNTAISKTVEGVDHEAPKCKAGPSAPRRTAKEVRGPNGHRKPSTQDGYDLPPLNRILEVGWKEAMVQKLEHTLSVIGRPAMKGEIVAALNTGWPLETVNESSSVSALALPEFAQLTLV